MTKLGKRGNRTWGRRLAKFQLNRIMGTLLNVVRNMVRPVMESGMVGGCQGYETELVASLISDPDIRF
jgi:hypothetical protein